MKSPAKEIAVFAMRTLMLVGVAALLCGSAAAQEAGVTVGPGNARIQPNAPAAASQGLVMQRNLSLGLAKTIAEASLAACREKGYHTTVAVVDRPGQLLGILRDEQASPQTARMPRRNPYTPPIVPPTTTSV